MSTQDEKERRRCEASQWSWYSVERESPKNPTVPASLTREIGKRLRQVYSIAQTGDAPAEVRDLLKILEAKRA